MFISTEEKSEPNHLVIGIVIGVILTLVLGSVFGALIGFALWLLKAAIVVAGFLVFVGLFMTWKSRAN